MNLNHPSRPNRHYIAGVTLIELMITIAVLAIVLGIGVPSFRELILQNRLSVSANEVLSALASTRSEAIKRNTRLRLCLKTGDLKWELRTLAPAVLREGLLATGVTVTANNLGTSPEANSECVDYRSDGLPYTPDSNGTLISNGSIALTLGSTTKTVHVRTGSIYVK